MDLCTVTNKKFIKSALNLAESYKKNCYNNNIFIYYFDMEEEEVNRLRVKYSDITFQLVPKIVDYAYDPGLFFYKVFSIYDCLKKTNKGLIYSDATNVFNKFVNIEDYLIDETLFLPYNNIKLINQYWTTKKCFEKMDCEFAKIMPQYWAGFQVYKKTEQNIKFVEEYFNYMKDPEIVFPKVNIKNPDGKDSICIEHRQDQSVLSILIHKNFMDKKYDHQAQLFFGDWQTFKDFDDKYQHDLENCCLSSRESKFGFYRFLNENR